MNNIKLLARLQLINSFGLNEARYCKDLKKRRRARMLLGVYAFLGVIIAVYAGALAFVYAYTDMAEIIPAYAMVVVSIVVLFMTIIKSGEGIFNMRTYERLAALPVKSVDIVISRFAAMYLINLALAALVTLPCAAIYAAYVNPGVSFYVMTLFSIALAPLLAMTIATILGAAVVAISSRIKRKNLVSIALMLIFSLGAMALPLLAVRGGDTEADFARLAGSLVDKLCAAYPPARLFSDAALNADWGAFALFAALSIGAFGALIYLLQLRFFKICSLLSATRAGGKYVVRALERRDARKALYIREMKRYVSSSIYVMNTSIGAILALIAGVALLIAGVGTIDDALGDGGFTARILPFAVSFMYVLSPTTTSAISIEGKHWWILRTLPIETRDIINAKLSVNITIALPAWLISTILLEIAVGGSFAVAFIPLAYILFSTILGLWMNIKLPIMEWDNETVVVKQSGAVGFSMLIGIASLLPPVAATLLLPALSAWIAVCACLILFGVAALIYIKLIRVDLAAVAADK